MGVFRATVSGRPVVFAGAAQRLLAYLALHGVTARSELSGALYPDNTQARAQSDLRTVLWRLQRVSRAFIETSGELLYVSDSVRVDVDDIMAWANEAISPTVMTIMEHVQLPRGAGYELLPGWDHGWLESHRTRVRMLQTQAYECIASRLLSGGREPEALPFALHVLQAEPLRESAQRLMLEIHLRQGNVGAALKQYEGYRTMLRRELGIAPGLRVTALISQYAGRGARVTGLSRTAHSGDPSPR